MRYTRGVPSQTSSHRAYGLRAQSARTAYSLAAILASLSVTPAYAVASHDGIAYDGVLSKHEEGEKHGNGVGRGNGNGNGKGGGKLPEAPAPAPAPTVEAPAVTPAPTVAPAPTEAPKPAPTQAPKPAPAQKPNPKPKPVPTQAAPEPPRSTPEAPAATPDRASTPSPTPGRDDRASGEGRDDRTGVVGGVMPGSDGSGPAATPVAPGATPGGSGGAGSAPAGRRAPTPRVTGGLVDMADRSAGGGSASTPVPTRTPNGSGTASVPVAYREDRATGRRVYAVPTPDGTAQREISVPGGVFGILPTAAIEAAAEVRGAIAEGGKRRSRSSKADVEPAPPSGVAETIARPLAAIDEATGGAVPPALVLAALAAMAVALGLGIRREIHRW